MKRGIVNMVHQKDGNELGVETQFYHRKYPFEEATTTLDGKEVSSDASVAGDIIVQAN
jgi:hypothetical protein